MTERRRLRVLALVMVIAGVFAFLASLLPDVQAAGEVGSIRTLSAVSVILGLASLYKLRP